MQKAEKYLYEATDCQFMPEFCNESFKNNAFNLGGNQIFVQITSGVLMFAQLFFAILACVHSSVAPVLSFLIAAYAILSIYCYFGLKNFKTVSMCQSYFAATKLSAFALGYAFDSLAASSSIEISFMMMTVLITLDAFLGFALITGRSEFTKDVKSTQFMVEQGATMSFFFDNWKAQQFKSNNLFDKNAAFVLTTLEAVFAFSAVFSFTGFQAVIAAFALAYACGSSMSFFRSATSH